MDNKELKGLSEAYNEVYLDEALPTPGKSKGAVTMYNKPRASFAGTTRNTKFDRPRNANTGYNSQGTLTSLPQIGSIPSSARNRTQYPQGVSTGIGPVGGGNAGASRSAPSPRPIAAAAPAPQPVQSSRTQRPSTGLATPASRPTAAPTSRSASPTPRPAATPKPSNSSPANLSTPDKIKSGMQVYNAQRSAGDTKGAASTGAGVWKDANPTLAAKPKTSYNPLMNKTFGYQTGNSPKEQQSRASAIVSSGQVAALKPATPAATPTPQKRNQAPTRAGTLMQSYDFGKPDHITQDVASLYQSIYEGKKKVDQDQDGDNDFADVRIARMVASGMSLKDAIAAVRNKSYNEETELDEGRSENIRDKMVARYGKPTSGDTLRLHVARKKYDKAATKHQSGYGPNPRTEIKGKLNPGQLMYKAGQSANVNKEEFDFWVNDLLDEGYDLSEYTVDEMYEIFEETALERRKAEEERKNNRRARVAEMQAQGRVMTPAKRAAAQRAAKAAEKREAALEKAAQAAINDIHGATGRVSEKPMGSEGPAAKKAAPVATRRLRTGLKRDTLGSAADAVLKAIRKEDFNLWVNELLDEGHDLSDYTWDELYEGYKRFPSKKVAKKINRMYDDPDTDIMFGKDAKRRHEMMRVHASMTGNVHPMIRSESPKRSQAKAKENRRKGEMKEDYDAYDLVIGHLLDEGFADDCDSANMMIERMSDEWLNEILESKKWIQNAIKKPGSLSKQLGVPEEENIPSKVLSAAAEKGGKLGQRARLAKTLRKFH